MKKFKKRRIFYLFPEDSAFIHSWQKTHFLDELKKNGVEVETVNPLVQGRKDYESKVIDVLTKKEGEFSLFMTAMNDYELSESFIKHIKKLNIPTLLICWDNLVIPFFHKKISKYFDLVWLTSGETEYLFKNWGANTIFLPYAANPFMFVPKNTKDIINRLLFIGSPHGGRKTIISDIASNGYEVDVYGKWEGENDSQKKSDYLKIARKFANYIRFDIGRKCLMSSMLKRINFKNKKYENYNIEELNINGPVSFDQMAELYSKYSLSLNITEYLDTYLLSHPVYKLHLRTFEIPMSGGLQITHRINEIENYFEDNKEIVLYDDIDELRDKLRFYLNKKNERIVSEMKHRSYVRSIEEHTWTKRFDKIFKILYI